MNLPLLAKQLYLWCRELGTPLEYLIRKRTITTLLHDAAKKGSRISIPKLDHEMLRDYFDGNL